ncbi:hypothetical protein [Arthrobacter sp. ZGTC131]|uniref:hypothetical protein n=1 Tax=Arthrobacter sp. ZGTC131 TaxID=2058898 RepID=UPI000CE3AF79|nr:hypothetical protein [Arthrobacter sp. ZGTC131]
MQSILARPSHLDSLADTSPGPLTITANLTLTFPGNQVNKGATMAMAPAAPQGGILTATGPDATTFTPPQLLPAHLEDWRTCDLIHAPWVGWYCETTTN